MKTVILRLISFYFFYLLFCMHATCLPQSVTESRDPIVSLLSSSFPQSVRHPQVTTAFTLRSKHLT